MICQHGELIKYRPDGKKILTRFDELWQTVDACLEIFAALEVQVEINFLNQGSISGLSGGSDSASDLKQARQNLQRIFLMGPSGPTPLIAHLRRVKQKIEEDGSREQEHFLLIFTDGEPSDGTVRSFKMELTQRQGKQSNAILKKLRLAKDQRTPHQKRNHLALVACTDNEAEVEYMNKMDVDLFNTDVVDDWFSETVEIATVHKRLGLKFDPAEQFTYGTT
jgi:hypothetical protein